MAGVGMPFEVIDEAVAAERAAMSFDVYEENWGIVEAFRMLGTQWRMLVAPMGGAIYQGLDYASVHAVLDELDLTREERREHFAGIRLMELAALVVKNRRTDDA